MYRRRRSTQREVAFSFDSFLDLVTNICGIIIRLILVAWVGARTYTASMENVQGDAAVEIAKLPPLPEDPLQGQLVKTQLELDRARSRLFEQLKQLQFVQGNQKEAREKLLRLKSNSQVLEDQRSALAAALADKKNDLPGIALSKEELRQRSQKLLAKIKELEKLPPLKKALRFHTPISHPVHTDEMMFECRAGRVTFVDFQAFKDDIEKRVSEIAQQARDTGTASVVAGPYGDFRMRFVLERQGAFSDSLSYRGTLEPVTEVRGETRAEALARDSRFLRVVGGAVPGQTVVTFWVYPDSFGLFRDLRDFLYERGLEVAGRPLMMDVAMGFASDGSKSRGQ
jgi:hypothetical protein